MTDTARKSRFTKRRLETVIEAARSTGGRVKVDLVSGEATIDFPVGANDLSHADEEGQRLEASMDEQMATGRGGR